MDATAQAIERSGYARALGVAVETLDADRVRLRLPYRDENSNPGQALHGGVAASLAVIGSRALGRAALGADSGPWHTAGLHIDYLAAAIGEEVEAESTLLRGGRELAFVETDVRTRQGKSIAHASAAVRGRFGAPAAKLPAARGDDGRADPGPMGPFIGRVPFIAARGIRVEHMVGGCSRLVMPWSPANAGDDGGLHEGAVLALLDTTGAMAAWAETGPGRFKASTPALQAQLLAPAPRADLIGFGRVALRDRELFYCDVEVATAGERDVLARGTVIYRIVT